VVFSSLRALPSGGDTWRTHIAWLPDVLLALAVAALAIALAGPRKGDNHSRIHSEGIAVVMAVDVSGSMRALDLAEQGKEQTRLDAVKGVFEKFVLGGPGLDGRDDDAIGLVAFAHYADTRSPLTLDHANLVTAARQLEFAKQDEDGTALGAGLELAVQRLAEFRPNEKVGRVVVLLTDGVSNIHDIEEGAAIDDAIVHNVKVYTIGAGTNGDALIRMDRGDGRTQLMHMPVEIDEAMLRKIADKTGGRYFRATDHDSLETIYKQIDGLERTKLDETRFTEYHQYYTWLVAIAMALVVAAFALRGSVLRRLP
jgi:Ca-activated chloride channel family protein